MNDSIEPEAADAVINKKRELPLIWLLPLCALLVTGWLIYKNLSDKGPEITIVFSTADGLEIDKTKIKYLDVEIGKITDISIKDEASIEVTAQMDKDSSPYLTKNTQFWVVKPRIGLGGVSGLSTLLSGAYIAIKPEKGDKERHFTGLAIPPVLTTNAQGTKFTLETTDVGSMSASTPISFHGIIVGQVLNYDLASDAEDIQLHIFINAPYDKFIRKNTRFWIDSGIDLSAGADGFKVRTGPLISLLAGGIAFRNPDDNNDSENAPENTLFRLFDNYEQSAKVIYSKTVRVIMYFSGSVRGLAIDAPVLLRGIPLGKVVDINLEIDEKTAEILIPVTVEIGLDRIIKLNKQANATFKENVDRLIAQGLRAQLQTGSLLTGQLFVALDLFPKSKVVFHENKSGYPEFPTIPNTLDQITTSAQAIMDKVSKLPLDETVAEANKTLKSLQITAKEADKALITVKGTLVNADTTIKVADKTLKTADKAMDSAQKALSTFEPGSITQYELHQLLQGLNQTASSVKQLTDYLEQHPDSLLRGKDDHDK